MANLYLITLILQFIYIANNRLLSHKLYLTLYFKIQLTLLRIYIQYSKLSE